MEEHFWCDKSYRGITLSRLLQPGICEGAYIWWDEVPLSEVSYFHMAQARWHCIATSTTEWAAAGVGGAAPRKFWGFSRTDKPGKGIRNIIFLNFGPVNI